MSFGTLAAGFIVSRAKLQFQKLRGGEERQLHLGSKFDQLGVAHLGEGEETREHSVDLDKGATRFHKEIVWILGKNARSVLDEWRPSKDVEKHAVPVLSRGNRDVDVGGGSSRHAHVDVGKAAQEVIRDTPRRELIVQIHYTLVEVVLWRRRDGC